MHTILVPFFGWSGWSGIGGIAQMAAAGLTLVVIGQARRERRESVSPIWHERERRAVAGAQNDRGRLRNTELRFINLGVGPTVQTIAAVDERVLKRFMDYLPTGFVQQHIPRQIEVERGPRQEEIPVVTEVLRIICRWSLDDPPEGKVSIRSTTRTGAKVTQDFHLRCFGEGTDDAYCELIPTPRRRWWPL